MQRVDDLGEQFRLDRVPEGTFRVHVVVQGRPSGHFVNEVAEPPPRQAWRAQIEDEVVVVDLAEIRLERRRVLADERYEAEDSPTDDPALTAGNTTVLKWPMVPPAAR